jgi:hypothetical protein
MKALSMNFESAINEVKPVAATPRPIAEALLIYERHAVRASGEKL